jgi:hypothetical protein
MSPDTRSWLERNGPKFKEAAHDESKSSINISGASINKFDAVDGKNVNLNQLIARKTSMTQLANQLSNLPGYLQ